MRKKQYTDYWKINAYKSEKPGIYLIDLFVEIRFYRRYLFGYLNKFQLIDLQFDGTISLKKLFYLYLNELNYDAISVTVIDNKQTGIENTCARQCRSVHSRLKNIAPAFQSAGIATLKNCHVLLTTL